MKELNKIYLQDCVTFMQELEFESVDLIIADPPYNLKKDFGDFLQNGTKNSGIPELWDGKASERIIEILLKK